MPTILEVGSLGLQFQEATIGVVEVWYVLYCTVSTVTSDPGQSIPYTWYCTKDKDSGVEHVSVTNFYNASRVRFRPDWVLRDSLNAHAVRQNPSWITK